MPKARVTAPFYVNTETDFRAFVAQAESMLIACGLTRTTDAGQVDPLTVPRPATANAYTGYSVWRFSDALQSVAPVFFKIEYGIGGSATVPSLRVTVGTASDGVGNIVGSAVTGPFALSPNGVQTTAPKEWFCVHNRWGFGIAAGVLDNTSVTTFGVGFAIQRTVSPDGEPSADAILVSAASAAPAATAQSRAWLLKFIPTLSVAALSGLQTGYVPGGLLEYTVGASPQIFPTWVSLPKVRPMAFLAAAPLAGAPGIGQTFQMAVVGTQPRTYICVGSSLSANFYSLPALQGVSFFMWED
jgi:hypothetical protein